MVRARAGARPAAAAPDGDLESDRHSDLAGTTASLLLAAVVSPITLLWGPIVSLNVVMILAPALSAWAANRLCRHITGAAWPSLLAGATYGFSTYEIAQLVGHPQMVVMICPPLVALCVIRLLEGTLPARQFVIEVSGLLIVQAFLSVEVLFTMTLVGMLAVAAYLATGTPEQRRDLTDSLWVLALPYLIAGIASSWYLLQVLRAPAYAAGAGASLYPTDGLSFFVPMPSTWIGGATLSSVTARFLGGPTETGAYLGLPLLLILGRYVITRRHTQTARVLAILMALLAIWIVGPNLYVAGHTVARLPYSLISSLPLLNENAGADRDLSGVGGGCRARDLACKPPKAHARGLGMRSDRACMCAAEPRIAERQQRLCVDEPGLLPDAALQAIPQAGRNCPADQLGPER